MSNFDQTATIQTGPIGTSNWMFPMLREFGVIDILVNNACIENKSLFLDMALEDWDKVMAVNLRGVFFCSQLAARSMVQNGGGAIINISSVHQIIPWGGYAHYCASKDGLNLLMKTMVLELMGEKVRVNNVAPGAIVTPINEAWLQDVGRRKQVLELIPSHRPARESGRRGYVSGERRGRLRNRHDAPH